MAGPTLRVLAPSAAVGVAAFAAWQAWLIRQAWCRADALMLGARPYEVDVPGACARVLLVGDSTGVGVGADHPGQTLCGLLAARFARSSFVNRCVSGARVADVAAQVEAIAQGGDRYDLVLVLAGANDLIRMTRHTRLRADARRLAGNLRRVAGQAVWVGCGVGRSPRLLPPLSWWAARRSRTTMQLLGTEAAAAGVEFVDFASPLHDRVFAREPALFFAADGVHPSPAGYLYCFEELLRGRPALAARLGAGLTPPQA